jgi:hypothetical protein
MKMSFQKKIARKRTPKPIARRANKRATAAAVKKPFVIGFRRYPVTTNLAHKPQHHIKPFVIKFR